MRKRKYRRIIRILIVMDLLILSVPFLHWYFYGIHGYLSIKTGKLLTEEMCPRDYGPGLFVKSDEKKSGNHFIRLSYSLDELNEKFPEDFQVGERVWILFVSDRYRAVIPEHADLIWIKKSGKKYKEERRT